MENIKKLQSLVEQATSDVNSEAPERLYPEILELVHSRADMPKIAVVSLSKRIGLKNKRVLLWSFNLLEFLSYNTQLPLYSQISTKEFLLKISGLLKNKQIEPEVLDKILKTIKCLQQLFRPHEDLLPLFFQFYAGMLRAGFDAPHDYVSPYRPKQLKKYSKPSQNASSSYNKIEQAMKTPQSNISKTDLQDFQAMRNQILLTNEIIDSANPSQGVKNNQLLKEMMEEIKKCEKKINQTINDNNNEKILELALAVNDDLYITFRRYKDLQRNKKPEPFFLTELASDFIKQEQTKNIKPSSVQEKKPAQKKETQQKKQEVNILDMDFNGPPSKIETKPSSGGDNIFDILDNSSPSVPPAQNTNIDLLGGIESEPQKANSQTLSFDFANSNANNQPVFDLLGGSNSNQNFSLHGQNEQNYRTDNDINLYSEKPKKYEFPDLLGSGK